MDAVNQIPGSMQAPVSTGWKKWKGLFLCLLFIKSAFIFLTNDYMGSIHRIAAGEWKKQLMVITSVNNDELLIGEVALNHNKGLGFVSGNEGKRKDYPYDFTAYRPTYPVYLHIGLMQLFQKLHPGHALKIDYTATYFILFGGCMMVISYTFFALSMFYFKSIAETVLNEAFSKIALCAYVLYPSVLLYIGNQVNYESLVTSMLIILFFLVLKSIQVRLNRTEISMLVILTVFSSLFRPQTNFIFIFLFGAAMLISFSRRRNQPLIFRQAVTFSVMIVVCGILFNIPVLIKNHRLFGAYTLSTTGFNFGIGHNPYARGGWCGSCLSDPSNPYYQYIRKEIKDYDNLDEYHKSESLQALSMEWIKKNPMAEIMLSVRKSAIFFLPYNNNSEKVNLFNLLVHAGTIIFCGLFIADIIRRKKWNPYFLMLLMPFAGSLAVTVLFHAGYRWRYYAEPFMVLCAVIAVQVLSRIIEKRLAGHKQITPE